MVILVLWVFLMAILGNKTPPINVLVSLPLPWNSCLLHGCVLQLPLLSTQVVSQVFCGVGKEHSLEFQGVGRAGIEPSPVAGKRAPEMVENHPLDALQGAALQLPSSLLGLLALIGGCLRTWESPEPSREDLWDVSPQGKEPVYPNWGSGRDLLLSTVRVMVGCHCLGEYRSKSGFTGGIPKEY